MALLQPLQLHRGRVSGPLRIEMVLPSMQAGGMEMLTDRLARALARRGHEVGITCTDLAGNLAPALHADGFRVSVVGAPGLRSMVRAPALERWLRELGPDVVHVHSGVWLKAARAARRAGVPRIVHTIHGLEREPWYGPPLKRIAARDTDLVVGVSRDLVDFLRQRVHVPEPRLALVPNGVDAARYRPGPRTGALRAALGIDDDRLLVGSVARLLPVKNHALLLEAFARAHRAAPRSAPRSALVLVGNGALEPSLRALADALGVGEHVHFTGFSHHVDEVLRDLDVFVLSSDSEGMPVSVLEAMATGLPVLATAVGSVPHLLDEGRCGVLVPPRDVEAMTGALAGLLAGDPVRRRELGAAARRRAVEHFSEEAMVSTYERAYYGEPLLPGPEPRPPVPSLTLAGAPTREGTCAE